MHRTTPFALCTVAACVMTLAGSATADLITLEDGNSSVEVDTGSSVGMNAWNVDGVDNAVQQWFWYRSGAAGGESSLDTLTQTFINTSNTNQDPGIDALSVTYAGLGFEIELLYTLRGGQNGSGVSDINEQIIIRNTGGGLLDFHFFQYSDFNLGGTADDGVEILGGNTASQWDLASGSTINETVVTPSPDHVQVAAAGEILAELGNGSPTTLSGATGPIMGDVTWAFQWDAFLAPGESFIIGKQKSIMSIPGPSALAVIGLAAMGRRRRRKA